MAVRRRGSATRKTRAVAVAAGVGATAAGVMACSVLFDVDDISGGSVSEAGSPDGGAVTDSGDAVPIDCEAAFCDDFDVDEPAGAKWDAVDVTQGGSVTKVTDAVLSRPNAMLAELADAAAGNRRARLRKRYLGHVSGIVCDVNLRPERLPTNTNEGSVALDFQIMTPTATYMTVRLKLLPSNTAVQHAFTLVDGGGGSPQQGVPFVDEGVWTHVRMALELDARMLTVFMGPPGQPSTPKVLTFPLPAESGIETNTELTFSVGVTSFPANQPGVAVRFDDVVCVRDPP